ncbi:metallophosphoesterase [uncultured Sphingomonas sp.]|uniref:metallophosphoesterase n=1 Tax=uncultured Sphingomonas sp. TaxID=158754 RepID=UPI0035CBBAC7
MRRLILILLLSPLLLAIWSYGTATSKAVVRRATVALPAWPNGTLPIRVLLWSDVHIGNPTTGPERLERLVAQANALRPDLIVIAGDFIAGHEHADIAAAPGLAALTRLRAPLGVVAVLGNHDHWTDPGRVRRVLTAAGVRVLVNEAVRRGPLAVGGLDDPPTRHADLPATLEAMRSVGGVPLLLSHSPEIAPKLPGGVPLLLAGHTHCGQVVLPILGAPVQVTAPRYRCGLVREGPRLTVVTAGTGTSGLPFRFGAVPDMWLLTLGP